MSRQHPSQQGHEPSHIYDALDTFTTNHGEPVKLCGMATKADLMGWAVEALEQLGGSAGVVDVSRRVWQNHEDELRRSGDLFYTWQYDLRWAATKLRKEGRLQPSTGRGVRGKWALV